METVGWVSDFNAESVRDLEARDRLGYKLHPQNAKEAALWEKVAAWPEW